MFLCSSVANPVTLLALHFVKLVGLYTSCRADNLYSDVLEDPVREIPLFYGRPPRQCAREPLNEGIGLDNLSTPLASTRSSPLQHPVLRLCPADIHSFGSRSLACALVPVASTLSRLRQRQETTSAQPEDHHFLKSSARPRGRSHCCKMVSFLGLRFGSDKKKLQCVSPLTLTDQANDHQEQAEGSRKVSEEMEEGRQGELWLGRVFRA